MDNGEDNPTHLHYQEFVCPDGYVSTKVPLNAIRFLDPVGLKARIMVGGDQVRYARYSDLVRNGAYANGVPVVYRTPKGMLFASDIRFSDVAIYAEQNNEVYPGVPRNTVHPLMDVRIIEVASREDIPVQRALWMESHQ
jgi:hypothetical protein